MLYPGRFISALTLCLLGAAWTARVAEAQTSKNEAENLFFQGLEAWQKDRQVTACGLFRASLALSRRASVLVRVGACSLSEKNYLQAWRDFQEARTLNDQNAALRRADLNDEIVGYLAQVPTLQISLLPKPADASVTVDGQPLSFDEIGIPAPMPLGEHAVTAEAPGYARVETKVNVARVQAYMLALTLRSTTVALEPAPPMPGRAQVEPPKSDARAPTKPIDGSERKTAAYVVGGAGVLTLAAAATLGVMTLVRVSDSSPRCQYADGSCDATGVNLRNEASRLQTAGLIVGAVGVVALSTGVFLLVTSPSTERTALASPRAFRGLSLGVGATW